MNVEEILSDEYHDIFKQHYHIYNSVPFNTLNEYKCDKVAYLLFHENKTKLGLIGGIKNGEISSPFSAPFGGFSANNDTIKFSEVNEAIQLLEVYSRQNNLKKIRFTLPPYFYNEDFFSKTFYSLVLNEYITTTDINFHFCTSDFANYKECKIEKKPRQNLNKALNIGLEFKQVFSDSEKLIVYNIIRDNKERKGRPTYVNFPHLLDVCKITTIDFFLVLYHGKPVASAIVYHVTEDIAQIVYWGDICEYSVCRSMNYLAFKVFEFYYKQKVKIIDLATSSLKGTPNLGLCNFKENIGCSAGLKYTMQKNIL